MKSKLTKSELLLKIAKLTNQVEGLSNEEIHEIKIFQKAFMKKFISENDKLKKEIEKMISLDDMEAMKEIFPKESQKIKQEGIKIGKEEGIEIGMEKGKEEGIEIGMEKGKEEGIEIGKEEEKIKTAENMKKEQINTSIIVKITGLSPEDIEKL